LNPQDFEALAPLYALDALDGEDLALFNEELSRSEPLRALVNEYRTAATSIPLSLEPVAPSPALKGRVLEAVAPAKPRSAPVFTRVFWAVAAIALFSFIGYSLLHPEVPVTAPPGQPPVSGGVRVDKQVVLIHVEGLPKLPPGKVYQLWHLMPGNPKPAPQCLFVLDGSGTLRGRDQMRNPITPECMFAITMEPATGSTTPTMPIYALAKN